LIVGGQPPDNISNTGNSIQVDISNAGNSTQVDNSTAGNSTQVDISNAGSNKQDPKESVTPISSWAIILFAALAGFNWEWTVAIFKRIGDSFKETTEPRRKFDSSSV